MIENLSTCLVLRVQIVFVHGKTVCGNGSGICDMDMALRL